MRIVIAGGSGFLGQALARRVSSNGHEVVVLTRRASSSPETRIRAVAWSPDGGTGAWQSALDGADVVVNLAGAGMADKRWTAARTAELRSSRLLSTRSLVAAITALPADRRPRTFIQGSAVGYYGASLDPTPRDETSPPGNDFLGHLAADWEREAHPTERLGCRLVVLRTGIVLDRSGGALPQMALPFKLFVGGHIASGRQMISWIHLDDWLSLVEWLIDTPRLSGPFNASAPQPATSRDVAAAIGKALGRPSWFPVPAFVLRIVVGPMADAALVPGQAAVPARAMAEGFRFEHAGLEEAVRHAALRR